jgi:predicted permease
MKTIATIRIFERGHRWLLRRLPAGDGPCPDDTTATLRDVCLAAHQRRGWWGLVGVGVLEWLNLAGHVVRAKLGRDVPTTAGGSSARPPAERTGIVRRLRNDLRLSWRGLAANRGSAGIAVATLALGIGLSTAVFSILDSMLFRPVPYREANRLVELAAFNTQRKFSFMGFYSPALIRAWRAETDLFDRIEGYDTPSLVYTTDAGSDMVAAAVVTPGLISLLGVPPQAGRIFGPGDGQTGTTRLAVVSDAFWRSALEKDPNAIGRELTFDNQRYQIIGIMPAAFRFPNGRVQVWVPYDVDHPPAGGPARTLTPIARTAPGVSRIIASSQARERGSRISTSAGEDGQLTAQVYGIANYVDDKTRQSLWILAGAVGFLFLVVCTNVANLALARSIQQGHDLAVRSALGASRGDLMRETLVESGLLAGAGCVAGIGLAVLLIRVALTVLPDSMMGSAMKPLSLDVQATSFAVALGALAALLFGLPAAVVASGASVAQLLGARSRGASASALSRRLRSGLVVAEVSVSILLLVGAALMTRSFLKLESVDKGFDSTNLISVRLGLPAQGYSDPAVRDRFMEDAVDRLRRTPGIVGATAGGLPTDTRPIMLGAVEFGHRPGELTEPLIVPMHDVTGDYFTMLGVPILNGRTFHGDDPPEAVVISDGFARKYWPSGQAIGGQFRRVNQSWQTVIGIVGNIRPMAADQGGHGLDLYYQTGKAPQGMVRSMSASSIADYRNLVVRADRPAQAVSALPQVIHAVDPHVVVWRIGLVDHLYADAIARPRTVLALMGTFAGVGLLLALAGIYSVLSYLVTQRVREIGIRLALGATPRDVGRLVLRSGLGLTGAGLVAGLVLAAALTRVMRTLLYEVGPSDPVSMGVVSGVLLVTAMVASWWPARRAMRINPVQLLRQD